MWSNLFSGALGGLLGVVLGSFIAAWFNWQQQSWSAKKQIYDEVFNCSNKLKQLLLSILDTNGIRGTFAGLKEISNVRVGHYEYFKKYSCEQIELLDKIFEELDALMEEFFHFQVSRIPILGISAVENYKSILNSLPTEFDNFDKLPCEAIPFAQMRKNVILLTKTYFLDKEFFETFIKEVNIQKDEDCIKCQKYFKEQFDLFELTLLESIQGVFPFTLFDRRVSDELKKALKEKRHLKTKKH